MKPNNKQEIINDLKTHNIEDYEKKLEMVKLFIILF